jgi:hypothetical protein
MPELTRREKAMLRNHWRSSFWMVRVCADGSVEARKKRGLPWSKVQTPLQARRILEKIRLSANGDSDE